MLKRFILLNALLALGAFGCSGMGTGVKIVEHPGLESGAPTGYVEMWVPTSFGMWMKSLEEGPVTCDTIHVSTDGLGEGEYLCTTKQVSWPGNMDSIRNRPIADNFSVCRFEMPAGEHDIRIIPGTICYPEDMKQKMLSGGYAAPGMISRTYSVPVFTGRMLVEANAVNIFRLIFWIDDGQAGAAALRSDVVLPLPEKPLKVDPYPVYYDALVKMLDDSDWGFRWYAAKRIRFVGSASTIPIVEERLKVEKHRDVRKELEKALEKLGD